MATTSRACSRDRLRRPPHAMPGKPFRPTVTNSTRSALKVDWGKITTALAAYQISQPSGFINPSTNIFGVDGEQRNRGLELNVFGELTEGVRLLGGMSYIDAWLTQTQGGLNQGNQAVSVPPFQLVAGGEWDLPFAKGLTVLGRVVYESAAFVDRANLQQMPDWAQVNLGRATPSKASTRSPSLSAPTSTTSSMRIIGTRRVSAR